QMDHDLELSLAPVRPHRLHRFAAEARRDIVAGVLAGGWLVVLLAAAIVCRGRRRPSGRAKAVLGGAALTVVLAAGIAHRSLPVMPTVARPIAHPLVFPTYAYKLGDTVSRALQAGDIDEQLLRKSPDQVFVRLIARKHIEGPVSNHVTGGTIRYERSPGNYSIRFVDEVPFFCYYDLRGREYRYPLR
ncbi:hypothetical protein LCGC14_2797390, partial [marine sediment metagenome]